MVEVKFILFALILISCTQKKNTSTANKEKIKKEVSYQTELDYSSEFIEYFKEQQIGLKGDSILVSVNDEIEIYRIPQYIKRGNSQVFVSKSGSTIKIKQVNYTDIQFTIFYNNQKITGIATIPHYFYFGSETTEFSDGEYLITKYFVRSSSIQCIDYIGLGNLNILNENTEEIYATIEMSGHGCEELLNGLTNEKLKKEKKLADER